jgi:hypothetical protein
MEHEVLMRMRIRSAFAVQTPCRAAALPRNSLPGPGSPSPRAGLGV